jgi:hypothetical protein
MYSLEDKIRLRALAKLMNAKGFNGRSAAEVKALAYEPLKAEITLAVTSAIREVRDRPLPIARMRKIEKVLYRKLMVGKPPWRQIEKPWPQHRQEAPATPGSE